MADDDSSDGSSRRLLLLLLIPVALIVLLAVTVIVAAVVGAFVLDIGDETRETPPQVAWEWSDGEGAVTVVHGAGETVTDPGKITVEDTSRGADHGADLATRAGKDRITEGDEITIDVGDGAGTVRLVWQSSDGSGKRTISEHEYGE